MKQKTEALKQEGTQKNKKKSFWSKYFSSFFIIAGFLWIGWLLLNNAEEVVNQFTGNSLRWVVISLMIGTISLLHNGVIFHVLLNTHTKKKYSVTYTNQLFFIGQMIRHMPGRFWGVVYQVNETKKEIPPIVLVKVNIDYTLISMAFSLLLSAAIVFYFLIHPFIALICLLIGIGFLAIALHFNWLQYLMELCQSWLPRHIYERISPYLKEYVATYTWKRIAILMILLISTWFFYLIAWQTFKMIYPALSNVNLYMIVAAYSAAWAVGFFAMLTPAGLGVREVVFVFLSAPVALSGDTAFLAIFVRVWLLVIDVILFLIFWIAKLISSGRRYAKTTGL